MTLRHFWFAVLILAPSLATAQVAGDLKNQPPTPSPVEAPTQTPQERVKFLLSAYHLFPTREQLASAGTDAEVAEILRNFAQSPDTVPTLRLKATDALAYYGDALTVAFLEHAVATPTNDAPEADRRTLNLIRHHAIMSLAKLKGAEALPALEPLLAGDDLQLKLTAISAAGKQCGLEGVARLRALRDSDKDRAVQHEIRKFVQN